MCDRLELLDNLNNLFQQGKDELISLVVIITDNDQRFLMIRDVIKVTFVLIIPIVHEENETHQ